MPLATASAVLQPQLTRLKQELLAAREGAHRVAVGLTDDEWRHRPAAASWSVAECLMHLNVTSERFLPVIDEAIRGLRARGLLGSTVLRRDFVGWMLSTTIEPPVRFRIKTPPPFVPVRIDPLPEVVERFDYLQGELIERLDRGAGLAWDRQRVESPFSRRVKYSLYSTYCVIAAHQRRHLWQAGQVRSSVGAHEGTRPAA